MRHVLDPLLAPYDMPASEARQRHSTRARPQSRRIPPFDPSSDAAPRRATRTLSVVRNRDIGYEEWASGAALSAARIAARSESSPRLDPAAPSALRDADLMCAHAADRLVNVAAQLRAGEIRPLTLAPAMSDAAVLAAVLAAMLSLQP